MADTRCLLCLGLLVLALSKPSLAQQSDLDGFRMPYRQVLKLTPDRFVTFYARKMNEPDLSSPSGATYRNGMDYYAQCLRLRTHLRERTLSSDRRRQLNSFRSALSHWEEQYSLIHGSGMGGTAWANIWEDDQIVEETTLSQLENFLHRRRMRSPDDSGLLSKQIAVVFREINRPDIHGDAPWLKAHEIDQLRKKTRDATAALKQAANALPAFCTPTIVKCLQQIGSNV